MSLKSNESPENMKLHYLKHKIDLFVWKLTRFQIFDILSCQDLMHLAQIIFVIFIMFSCRQLPNYI